MRGAKIPIMVDEEDLQDICDVGRMIEEITGKESTIKESLSMSLGIAKAKLWEIVTAKREARPLGNGRKKGC